nr:bacterial Ig-like domain-containing protein [Clostridiales bacterium]
TAINNAKSAIDSAVSNLVTPVGLNTQGGSLSTSSTTVKIGSATTATLDVSSFVPTRSGYDFLGWATTTNGTPSKTTLTVGINSTIYAIWTESEYTLTVDPNGGVWNGSSGNSQVKQKYMSSYTLANPTRDGASFLGWTVSSGAGSVSGSVYTFGIGNGTVTAQWSSLPSLADNDYITVQDGNQGYYIYATVNWNGATPNRVQFPSYTVANGNDDVQQNWQTDSGSSGVYGPYTVNGKSYDYRYFVPVSEHNNKYTKYMTEVWAYNSDGVGIKVKEIVFEFVFTITLDNQGADAGKEGTAAFYEKYGAGNYTTAECTQVISKITVPEKSGYSFEGYYTLPTTGGTRKISSAGAITTSTSAYSIDTTLYARWKVTSYTVTLDNRGAATGGTASVNAQYNQPMPIISIPAKLGYDFGGYFASIGGIGTQYYSSTGTSAHVWDQAISTTIYAHWIPSAFTVRLDSMGATTAGTTTVSAVYGADMPEAIMPTKTGYTFGGYFLSSGGNGTQYYNADGTSAHVWDQAFNDVSIYAKWVLGVYKITLNNQGAKTPGTAEFYEKYSSGNYSDEACASPLSYITIPTKTNYIFDGYYTEMNGAGTQCVNSAGKIVSSLTYFTGPCTLFAKWTRVALESITVTSNPTKIAYYTGDTLDTTGLRIRADYNDGSYEALTEGFTCSPTLLTTAGTQAITVTYQDKTATFNVTVTAVALIGISVKTEPTKTTYYVGETLDTSGLTLTATYNNGVTQTITSGFNCTPTALNEAGEKTISVTYDGMSTSFNVTVNQVVLLGITVKTPPTKTSYFVGDTLNTAGLSLSAAYNNGNVETITSGFACSPTALNESGTKTITVSYSGKTTTFTVTVNEIVISSISVKTQPTKTSYFVGETLDTSGLTLLALYNNGNTQTVTSGFTCSPTALNEAGSKAITVTYSGKTTTFNVRVMAIEMIGISVKTMPTKTTYYMEDPLETAGLTLTATYNNGTTETVTEGFTCSPTTFAAVGQQTITVTYLGQTTTFSVTVEESAPTLVKSSESSTAEFVDGNNGTNFIRGINTSTSVDTLMTDYLALEGRGRVEFVKPSGEVFDVGVVGTGTVVNVYKTGSDALIESYTIVIYGDITGNGVVDGEDLIMMKPAAAQASSLPEGEAFAIAADITGDGIFDSSDLIQMKSVAAQIKSVDQTTGLTVLIQQ